MKKRNVFLSVAIIVLFSINIHAQKKGKYELDMNEVPSALHVNLDDFPKDGMLPVIYGWGGMAVDINKAPAGSDFTPLLEGLENDKCQVPHWGYVIEGSVNIIFQDGTEEVFAAGEAFFMKPGHTAVVLEDLLLVSFSPEEHMHELVDHINEKVEAMQAAAE